MLFPRLPSEKVALRGSKHADNLNRFQVSGVRFQYRTSAFPDTRHLKPETFIYLAICCQKNAPKGLVVRGPLQKALSRLIF